MAAHPSTEAHAVAGSPVEDATRLFTGPFADELEQWEAERAVPRSAFERLGETGVFGARWPADGPPGGDVDVAEALARESALLSLGVNLCVGLQSDALIPCLRQSSLPDGLREDAERGLRAGCIAISERTSGSDVTNCETVAERSGDGWSISGHKHYVSNFHTATDCVTLVRTGRRSPVSDFTVFVVPTDTPGLAATKHSSIGLHCAGTSMVDFDAVEVADECRVGAVGGGLQVVLTLLRRERMWAAVGCAALAELLLETALAYANRRVIQEQPLVTHQAMRHRLADMALEVDVARAYIRAYLDKSKRGRLTTVDAARAKLVSTRVLWRVADETMQVVGGRAYTDETSVGRIWRDARVTRIGGGTDEVLKELVAGGLRPGGLAGRREVQEAAEAASS